MKSSGNRDKQKETLVKVLHYMKPYGFFLGLTILMAVISVAFTLYLPILTGDAVDMLSGIGEPEFWPGLFAILKKMAVDRTYGNQPMDHEYLQ